MVHGLLSELEDRNCWTLAEAAGHACPYRMQHLLSRARCDEQRMLDTAADWAVCRLSAGQDEEDVVLIVDETADEKSSDSCAGASHQYSGAVGGIAMCQVAVTFTWAARTGHALIGRALYLSEGWAADEERRELAGVPDEITFETKPQLADDLLQHAHDQGIRAGFVAGDEVYGGLDLRKSIRARGTGYVLAVRSNYVVTLPPGRRLPVKTAASLVKPAVWQRMRTGSATKGAKDYHWAMIEITARRHPRGTGGRRARVPAAQAAPLYRHRQLLPVLEPGPGPAGEADLRRGRPVENRDGLYTTGKKGGAAHRGRGGGSRRLPGGRGAWRPVGNHRLAQLRLPQWSA